jgi:hypothetical protein
MRNLCITAAARFVNADAPAVSTSMLQGLGFVWIRRGALKFKPDGAGSVCHAVIFQCQMKNSGHHSVTPLLMIRKSGVSCAVRK